MKTKSVWLWIEKPIVRLIISLLGILVSLIKFVISVTKLKVFWIIFAFLLLIIFFWFFSKACYDLSKKYKI